MVFNITIICHSSNDSGVANGLTEYFKQTASTANDELLKSTQVHIITETTPEKISTRADYIKNATMVIACLDRSFQRSTALLELIHFVRELKKPLYGLNANRIGSYVPFGALGAIVCSTDLGLINVDDHDFSQIGEKIISNFEQKVITKSENKALVDMKPIIDPSRVASAHVDIKFSQSESEVNILISHHSEDSREAVDIIIQTLESKGIPHEYEQTNLIAMSSGSGTKVKNASVIVLIMSKNYEENYVCRTAIEMVRQLGKKIVPISTSREFKPAQWMALFLAGKLFFRIINREQAFKKKHEWHYSQMDSLVDELRVATSPSRFDESDAEAKLIESLSKQIEECKAVLRYWPPEAISSKKYVNNIVRKPVVVKPKEVRIFILFLKLQFLISLIFLQQKKISAELEFHATNYTMQQVFHPPKDLFDKFGVPLREKFDCMLSYQWDKQDIVKQVFTNCSLMNISAWFDIWGGMKGSVNDSMAVAVECSKTIVVFLTNKYLASANCIFEFKYAIECGKAMVFVKLEPLLQTEIDKLPEWFRKEILNPDIPQYELNSADDLVNVKVNNVPMVYVLAQAIRDVAVAQPDYDAVYLLSDRVAQLKFELNSGLDEAAKKTGKERYLTCTRCTKQFEERENKIGDCKMHSSYYMGGSIIAGRWVCCNQTEEGSYGCVNTRHSTEKREWHYMKDYGTYEWLPK
jgi:hypothetical protein